MPLDDTAMDRLKDSFIQTIAAQAGGNPAMQTVLVNVSGVPIFSSGVPGRVTIDASGGGTPVAPQLWPLGNDVTPASAVYGIPVTASLMGFDGTNNPRLRVSTVGTGFLVAAEPDYSYTHIGAGQATTVVKASAGFLHNICFNGLGSANAVVTIYDHASGAGTVVAIINPPSSGSPFTLTYDIKMPIGITIIGTIANGGDMTVSWR